MKEKMKWGKKIKEKMRKYCYLTSVIRCTAIQSSITSLQK